MKIQTKQNIQDYVDEESNAGALTPGKIYTVIGVTDDCFRFLNDDGLPFLYPKKYFRIVDSHVPNDWIREDFPEGEYYIDPPSLAGRGFFEDYFDRKPYAVEKLAQYLRDHDLG